jgi:Family of unknown function (DUF6526)
MPALRWHTKTCDDIPAFNKEQPSKGATMPAQPQNHSNYKRYDPLFHFVVLPVFALLLLGTIVALIVKPDLHAVIHVIVVIAAAIAVFKIRTYPLKVQDRVIRLEERLRLSTLLDPALRPRIAELTESQLIALRFASDAELPSLAARALNEKLSGEEIRKAIQNWRPDNWRI